MLETLQPANKPLFYRFFFGLFFFMAIALPSMAQTSLQEYIDSARANNPGMIQLQKQIQLMELGKKNIKSIYQAPKGYITSDINLTPYFNNNGQLFTTNPQPNAIGYDIGITNGGLYSALMNVDIPLFAKKPTQNALFWQEQNINRLKINLRNLNYSLEKQITILYYNALGAQLSYITQKESVALLKQEVAIMKQLTMKGLYKLVDYELLKTTLSSDSINLESLTTAYRLQLLQLKSYCGITNTNQDILEMKNIVLSPPKTSPSSFLLPYTNDSLTAIAQNRFFNNKYLPQVTFYSNAGINAITLNGIQRKAGFSTGIRLTYTLFDGKQKQLNKAQSLIQIDQANRLKKIKSKDIHLQRTTLLESIKKVQKNLQRQKKLKQNYKRLIELYKTEVQKGQVPVISFLMTLRNYNNIRLSYRLEEVKLNKLISEYNYWNH